MGVGLHVGFYNQNLFEVIILARTGYSTSQELILLKKEAFLYHPDLIIWSYCLNDPAHPVYHDANGGGGKYFFKPKSHFLYFISERLFRLNEKIKSRNCRKEFHVIIHHVYWRDVRHNIREIGEISKRKNTSIVFLIHPVFEMGAFKRYSLEHIHKKLAKLASREGLIVLDILDVYKNYNGSEIKQHIPEYYDPWHPNAKGHKIIADYLYRSLLTSKLLI